MPDSNAIITLTTDFGVADPYVAAMKGVILSINPDATIVDISHDVAPQQIRQAAFITQCAWPYFPQDAVHVAVVDPGVGTERRAIVMSTNAGLFVGPDNGVLSAALPDAVREKAAGCEMALPEPYRAFSITESSLMRKPISATFQGRDVFAPIAAHLSVGLAAERVGERVSEIEVLPLLSASSGEDGSLRGALLHIDRFGNIITDVRADDLPAGEIVVEIAGQRIEGLARTYADASGLCAIVGSAGYVEVALPGDNAAEALGVAIDDPVIVRPA